MPVITIAREYGAGGLQVASVLSEALDAELVDRVLVAEVARRLGLSPDTVEAEDERPKRLVDRLVAAFGPFGEAYGAGWGSWYGDSAVGSERAVWGLTEDVIREVARRGNSIIVGRGGAFVLADEPGVLHVFLRAAEATRVRVVMNRDALTEDDARRLIHQTDGARASYMREHYGADWRDPRHYDLVIDTGRLGPEHAAEIILTAVHCPPTGRRLRVIDGAAGGRQTVGSSHLS